MLLSRAWLGGIETNLQKSQQKPLFVLFPFFLLQTFLSYIDSVFLPMYIIRSYKKTAAK